MTEDIKPWTIKGVAPEERNAAIAAAGRNDMTMGEWMARAIRTQIQAERDASRAPVVTGHGEPPAPAAEPAPATPIADLEALLRISSMTTKSGRPNRAIASLVTRQIKERLTTVMAVA